MKRSRLVPDGLVCTAALSAVAAFAAAAGNAAPPEAGAKVTVTGEVEQIVRERHDKGESSVEEVSVSSLTGPVTHRLLVIIARSSNGEIPIHPLLADVFTFSSEPNSASVKGLFHEQSYGQFDLEGRVVGVYTLNASQCFPDVWREEAAAAAANDPDVVADGGLEVYDSITYIFNDIPDTDCVGSVAIGSKEAVIYGRYLITGSIEDNIGHVLGHNLGVGDSRAVPGPPGSILGDRSTTMGDPGYGYRHFVAPHKIELGWVPSGPAPAADRVKEVAKDGLYSIAALEIAAAPGQNHVLKFMGVQGYEPLYVSYRTRTGFYGQNVPNDYAPKMNIHEWAGGKEDTYFHGDDVNNTQAVPPGKPWRSAGDEVCLTMVNGSPWEAHIWVSFGCDNKEPEACPEVAAPCSTASCTVGLELEREDQDYEACVTSSGVLFSCPSEVVSLITKRCHPKACCNAQPPCTCSCTTGQYLECRDPDVESP